MAVEIDMILGFNEILSVPRQTNRLPKDIQSASSMTIFQVNCSKMVVQQYTLSGFMPTCGC